MKNLSATRLQILKEHLSNGGDLFYGGKRIAQVELRSSVNDSVYFRFEHETAQHELNIFSFEFVFVTIPSVESYIKHIESENSEKDWAFDVDYVKACKMVREEREAETAFFRSHPELNP